MTTTMKSSRFGLDDMEALLYGPPSSCPMADPMGALLLLHREREDEGPPRPRGGAASSSASASSSPASSPLSSSSSLTPPSSSSSSSSPPPFYSPSPSPPTPLQLLLHGDEEDKAGPDSDMLSLAWLGHPDQLGRTGTSQAAGMDDDDDNDKEAAFCNLDWMTERMDLSEFDLDTLIGPCSPHDDAPSSPQGLLEALDCPMDLDSLPPLPKASSPQGLLETLDCPMDLDCPVDLDSLPLPAAPADLATASVPTSPPQTPSTETCLSVLSTVDSVSLLDGRGDDYSVPEAQEELEIKSEPVSPAPPPSSSSTSPSPVHVHSPPPSPTYTLDLGSEVDVAECCEVKPTMVSTMVSTMVAPQQVPRIVLSLSPTRIVLVLAPKREISTTTTTVTTTVTTRPEVVYSSDPGPVKSHRTRPYPDPKSRLSPPSPPPSTSSSSVRVRCPRGGAAAAGATMKEERLAPSPAARPVKEKKLKKMEQNKTAATRYRQKKRVEHEQLSVEYGELEKKNIELTEKAESMAREIQYLKELMDEVRLTRMKKGLGADL